jgi:fermentation-respiration switch protein FrsA (DUF1100 family)
MRKDVEINAEGTILRGWFYTPDRSSGKAPAIVMAHGFSAVKEMYLERFAEHFCEAGLAAVVFDNRNFGASDGQPRQEIDPWLQVRDYRHAITWARTQQEVDPERIGVVGLELFRRPRTRRWRDRSARQVRGLPGPPDKRLSQHSTPGASRLYRPTARSARCRPRCALPRRSASDDTGGRR